ncbi:MAG: hypothetical protein AB8H86_21110 [Polyangiales bacterium]
MRGRHVGALVMFVLVLAAAMFTYIRTRPAVSGGDLREALEEVEAIRDALEDVECPRPAFWGPPSEPALPVSDLLRHDGPFRGCFGAYVDATRIASIHETGEPRPSGFELFVTHSPRSYSLVQSSTLEQALETCAPFAEEVRRQAGTPNRCTPYGLRSELGYRQASRIESNHFARALAMVARYGEMPDEERLRLLIQGMAVTRDLGQGANGFEFARASTRFEDTLAAAFVHIAQRSTISADVHAELHQALGVLADMHVNAHALVGGEGLWQVEEFPSIVDVEFQPESERRRVTFASAMFLSRLTQTCPPGTTMEACMAFFPYAGEVPDERIAELLGPLFIRSQSLAFLHAQWTYDYPDKFQQLLDARWSPRALQEILRWSGEAKEGRCPAVSSWDPEAHEDRFYVEQNNEGVYRLVTPGVERRGYIFRCSAEVPAESP